MGRSWESALVWMYSALGVSFPTTAARQPAGSPSHAGAIGPKRATSSPQGIEGATLLAPATGVAPHDGPSRPCPAQHGGVSPVIFRRRGGRAMPSRWYAATACKHSPQCKSSRLASVLPSPGVQTAQMGRPPGVTWAAWLRKRWRAGASLMRPDEGRCKRRSTSGEKGGDGRGVTISLTLGS